MKTVLLTGAGGFVGRTTIRHLVERGYVVHAISSREFEEIPDLVVHKIDLLDSKTTREIVESVRATHLLHCAWFVEHGKFWNAPENVAWVRASERLFESFVAAGGRRIVSVGTCAEYDWHTEQHLLSESSSPICPRTLYGQSKHAVHLSLQKIAEESGISSGWGRIFFLFGAFEQRERFVPSVIRSLLKGEEAKCTAGAQVRDLMFVEDAGDAFSSFLDSDVHGAVNIASGEGRTLAETAALIAKIIGRPELLRLGALPAAEDEPARIVADTTRLRDEVKFSGKTSLHLALEKTIDWWRNQK